LYFVSSGKPECIASTGGDPDSSVITGKLDYYGSTGELDSELQVTHPGETPSTKLVDLLKLIGMSLFIG
jgi:hypothetical protein